MITEMLATQLTEQQTVTIDTAAYDVRVSQLLAGYPFLRQCRDIPTMADFGYRYFDLRDNIIIRSLLVQVPAPIAISSAGIPIFLVWIDTAGVFHVMRELAENTLPKCVPVPFENSELVLDTPVSFPASCNTPASIAAIIQSDVAAPEHLDCRFHMTGVPAAFNTKVIPITVYARIEHTLLMVVDP